MNLRHPLKKQLWSSVIAQQVRNAMETNRVLALPQKTQPLSKTHKNKLLEGQISRLNRIGIALSSEHNLKRLLEMIVEEARHFTNADGGSLYIREGDKLNFIVAQTESLRGKAPSGGQNGFRSSYLPLTKESIGGYVAITGTILNLDDAYLIPPTVEYRLNKDFDNRFDYRTKSMLIVPMRDHEDDIIGVLQLINSLDENKKVIPFKPEYETLIHSIASQAAVAIRNAKLIEEIKNLFRSLVRYSARAIDARSPHTAGHSGRVAKYCVRIMEAINEVEKGPLKDVSYSAQEIEEMRMAGWLHDIGKIGVRESVLEKRNKLTDEKMEAIATRFAFIKSLEIIRNEEPVSANTSRQTNGHAPLNGVNGACANRITQIDDDLIFLKRINLPGFLQEDDRTRLKEIAEKTYVDLNGETHYFLTPVEYENLSVIRGNLTNAEYREIQSHVDQTLSILENIPFTKDLENIPKFAAAHHEMLDGSGYPRGLVGDQIPLRGRIMAVSDVYDALTASDRPYKKAVPIEKSLAILRDEADRGRLDSVIVELFIEKRLYERRSETEDDDE